MSALEGGFGHPPEGLSRGDTLGSVSLPDSQGTKMHLGAHSNIGLSCVLWLPEARPDPIGATMWAGRIESFRAAGAVVYIVVDDAPAAAGQVPPALVPALVSDPDARVRRAIGLAGSGIAVFEPDFRLAELIQGNRLEVALAACSRAFERSAPATQRTTAPVLMLHDVLEPELCTALIAYWEGGEKTINQVVTQEGSGIESGGLKRRGDVWLDDPALQEALGVRLSRRVVPQLFKAFNFKAAKYQKLRIGCYDSADAGAFGRHRDNTTPLSAHRQFAVSVNLNTGEYEGGKLWFPEYGRQVYEIGLGGAALFSCSILHEAMPVIAGRRFGLFGFFFDADAVIPEGLAGAG